VNIICSSGDLVLEHPEAVVAPIVYRVIDTTNINFVLFVSYGKKNCTHLTTCICRGSLALGISAAVECKCELPRHI
jgi:hypothetical protein